MYHTSATIDTRSCSLPNSSYIPVPPLLVFLVVCTLSHRVFSVLFFLVLTLSGVLFQRTLVLLSPTLLSALSPLASKSILSPDRSSSDRAFPSSPPLVGGGGGEEKDGNESCVAVTSESHGDATEQLGSTSQPGLCASYRGHVDRTTGHSAVQRLTRHKTISSPVESYPGSAHTSGSQTAEEQQSLSEQKEDVSSFEYIEASSTRDETKSPVHDTLESSDVRDNIISLDKPFNEVTGEDERDCCSSGESGLDSQLIESDFLSCDVSFDDIHISELDSSSENVIKLEASLLKPTAVLSHEEHDKPHAKNSWNILNLPSDEVERNDFGERSSSLEDDEINLKLFSAKTLDTDEAKNSCVVREIQEDIRSPQCRGENSSDSVSNFLESKTRIDQFSDCGVGGVKPRSLPLKPVGSPREKTLPNWHEKSQYQPAFKNVRHQHYSAPEGCYVDNSGGSLGTSDKDGSNYDENFYNRPNFSRFRNQTAHTRSNWEEFPESQDYSEFSAYHRNERPCRGQFDANRRNFNGLPPSTRRIRWKDEIFRPSFNERELFRPNFSDRGHSYRRWRGRGMMGPRFGPMTTPVRPPPSWFRNDEDFSWHLRARRGRSSGWLPDDSFMRRDCEHGLQRRPHRGYYSLRGSTFRREQDHGRVFRHPRDQSFSDHNHGENRRYQDHPHPITNTSIDGPRTSRGGSASLESGFCDYEDTRSSSDYLEKSSKYCDNNTGAKQRRARVTSSLSDKVTSERGVDFHGGKSHSGVTTKCDTNIPDQSKVGGFDTTDEGRFSGGGAPGKGRRVSYGDAPDTGRLAGGGDAPDSSQRTGGRVALNTSRRTSGGLAPGISQRTGGGLAPDTSRRVSGIAAPDSSRRTGGRVAPDTRRRTGGGVAPDTSRRSGGGKTDADEAETSAVPEEENSGPHCCHHQAVLQQYSSAYYCTAFSPACFVIQKVCVSRVTDTLLACCLF